MRATRILGLIAGFSLLSAAALAQGHGGHQHGMGMAYDTSREATYTGTVAAVATVKRGERSAVVLTVKTGDKDVQVMAGPAEFLSSQKFTFSQGDALSILGVMAEGPRGARIMPREITRGSDKLILRDKDGKPLWSMPEGR